MTNKLNMEKKSIIILLELRRVRIEKGKFAQLFFNNIHHMSRNYQVLQQILLSVSQYGVKTEVLRG